MPRALEGPRRLGCRLHQCWLLLLQDQNSTVSLNVWPLGFSALQLMTSGSTSQWVSRGSSASCCGPVEGCSTCLILWPTGCLGHALLTEGGDCARGPSRFRASAHMDMLSSTRIPLAKAQGHAMGGPLHRGEPCQGQQGRKNCGPTVPLASASQPSLPLGVSL